MIRMGWLWICRREWAVTVVVVLGFFTAVEGLRLLWNFID